MPEVIKAKPESHIKTIMEYFPEKVNFFKMDRAKTKNSSVIKCKIQIGTETLTFAGVGNNYKKAKEASATCALRDLQKRGLILNANA
jgi:hypothetical protein